MRSIMGFLPVVKEGPKGMPGLKVDFQTIPIAIPIDMNICIYYRFAIIRNNSQYFVIIRHYILPYI